MPNQRRPGWGTHGVAMPDELWTALRALVPKHYPSVGTAVRAACERLVKDEAGPI